MGKEKFDFVHDHLISIGYDLLKQKTFSNINFSEIAKNSNISKTTIYEHFDSDTNKLFLETLKLFQRNIIFNIELTSDPKKNIINIYETIFEIAVSNPLLFSNMHMIAINLNTINKQEYKYESKIFKLIENNYKMLTSELDFISNWSIATILCLQIKNPDFDFFAQKKLFFRNLKISINKN